MESESRKVGNVAVPLALLDAIRAGACLQVVLDDTQRVALLLEEYGNFTADPEAFCERLAVLTELRGKALVEAWKLQVRSGQIEKVVLDLLVSHYDPTYLQSMGRNFSGFATAALLEPENRSAQAMDTLAASLLSAG